MAGKRSKPIPKEPNGDDAKKTKNKAEAMLVLIPIRQQVLPKETLLEVFNCSKRVDLDQWGTVSRQYDATIQRVHPLREVETVILHYDYAKKAYEAYFSYKEVAAPNEEPLASDGHKHRIQTSTNVSDIVEAFFGYLRFCKVDFQLRIEHFPTDRVFLERLKDVSKHFVCEDKKIDLEYTTGLKDGVGPLDLFCAFPSHRAISSSTLRLLSVYSRDSGDAFLRSLAEHDVWDIGDPSTPFYLPATDAGILEFAFGAYTDDEGVRRLNVTTDKVSRQFLVKLVKACRECACARPLDICLEKCGDFDIDDLRANGRLETIQRGRSRGYHVWKFRFDDLPVFEVVYMPSSDQRFFGGGKVHFWRDCTPKFMFA